jgi:hypothetical protein
MVATANFSCTQRFRVIVARGSISSAMYQFRPYALQLRQLAETCLDRRRELPQDQVEKALNGEASQTLYAKVPVDVLRRASAFFSPPALADEVVSRVAHRLANGATVLDPACGAGDLLLACARKLPVFDDIDTTLQHWGTRLYGFDIHEEFIHATKSRLLLLAITRVSLKQTSKVIDNLDSLFPNIRCEDFLKRSATLDGITCVVMNPPFQRANAPRDAKWGTGRVTRAAMFVDKCLQLVPARATISALLPDVLRSGTNYRAWRELVKTAAVVSRVKTLGVFDERADVDVFAVSIRRRKRSVVADGMRWLPGAGTGRKRATLESICSVRVGTVVPFRDRKRGAERPYVTTASLPPWGTTTPLATRKYAGETFLPPFIAVRRTSRPNDQKRAVATVVRGDEPIAVENHVLVLVPKAGTLKQCKHIVRVLRDQRTTDWLNTQICCRHLTTRVLKKLPLWFGDD